MYRTTLCLIFVGYQVRKTHANVYQQSKFKYIRHSLFQENIKLLLHCQEVSTRIESYSESNIFTCYFSLKLNKNVYPIALQQYILDLGMGLL